jgi:hypothetical protein
MAYGDKQVELELDLLEHRLWARTSDGEDRAISLPGKSVATFHRVVRSLLSSLGVEVHINDHPCEIATEAIPFHLDELHATYDRGQVERFFHILWQTAVLFEEFRTRFIGKSSPVHFWWGSFDLALTRFSGRRAPLRPDADAITREAYSHECWSAGFWPGDVRHPEAAFYAYAAPPPGGFDAAVVAPASARWDATLGEYLLPYEAMCRDPDPRAALLSFLQSSYEAAAELGHWDRRALERERDQISPRAPNEARTVS